MSLNSLVGMVPGLALTYFIGYSQARTCRTADSCDALAAVLPSKVFYPNSTAYSASLSSYWAQQEQLITPSCILRPTTAEDVSIALKEVLVPNAGEFAVRSGGHGSVTGTANIEDGVTIDLSGMNGTELSEDQTEVSIGGGQKLGNVYSFLAEYGLAFAGARDSNIGVGGSTLGGGLGFFAPRYGFAADSVIEYEVVLANGSIVTANNVTNSDLWRALKGGGGNFGIVTNFVFSTFPMGQIWAGDAEYYGTAVEDAAQALFNFASDPDYDVDAATLMTYHYDSSTGTVPVIAIEYTYDLPVSNASAFDEFRAIPGQLGNSTALTTLPDFSVTAEETSPDGSQQITFAMSYENSVDMLLEVWNIFNASLAGVEDIEGISWSLTLEPIVKSMISAGEEMGGDILGIDLPSNGLILTICSASFTLASDYAYMSKATDQLLEDLISASKSLGVYNRFIDMNHAKAVQNPIAGYGTENWEFLNATAAKYDPDGVFQTLKPGGFKL